MITTLMAINTQTLIQVDVLLVCQHMTQVYTTVAVMVHSVMET